MPSSDTVTTGPAAGADTLFDRLQHQVALFARRAEQTRLGGVGKARNSMDRAAYLLLNRLDREGPMGVKALAEGMGIDSSTVTRQVAPLVESGLVNRTSHPEDGRAVVLALSPGGRQRLEEVRESRRELMALVTGDWSERERESFCDLLGRFNRALSDYHATISQRQEPDEQRPADEGASGGRAADAGATGEGPAEEAGDSAADVGGGADRAARQRVADEQATAG